MKNILRNSNFKFIKCCVALVAAGWVGAVSAEAEEIIAGWDFQTTTSGGTAVVASPNTQTLFSANVGSGTLYLNGSEGSSTWASATELNGFAGTATNAVNGLSTVTTSPSALALLGGTGNAANGKSISFKFSMTEKKDLQISFAGQRSSSGFASLVWEWSANGTTWSPIGTISSGTTTGTMTTKFANSGVLSLPTVTGLNGATTAYVRATFSGATGSSGNNRLDNIRFMASADSGGTVPTISDFSPSSEAVGASVTINGSNFGASPVVKFNGTTATSSVNAGGTQITATVPAGATSGKISVEVAGQTTATSATDFTVTEAGAATVSVTGETLTAFSTLAGTASAAQSFTVSGQNLTSDITVTAPTGFEVSTDAESYASSKTLTQDSGTVAATTISVRIAASTAVGTLASANVTIAATDVTTANIAVSGTVTLPALTLVLAANSVAENAGANATTGTVGIPASLGTDLVVNLVSTNTAAATVPADVTISAGQTSATFDIAAVANTSSYGPATTSIEASNSNYTTASATLTVTNVDVPTAPLAAKGWINEFHYDNSGSDTGEFVEIVLAPGTSTSDVSVVLYNGLDGKPYTTGTPAQSTFPLSQFVAGESSNGFTIYSLAIPGIQNGPDGLVLIIDGVPEDLVSYEGSFAATDGPAAGYNLPDIGIAQTSSEPAGSSLYRYGPGNTGMDFAWAKATVATPGQVNAGQTLGATGVQGTGTLAIANGTANSAFVTQNIFPKATAGQTVSLTLTGTLSSGTISAMSVVVPAAFTELSAGNVTVAGTGAGTPVTTLIGSTLTITGLIVDQLNPVTINIGGLTTPETAGDLTKDGNYPFTVQTGVEGDLQAMLLPTIAVVTIPIANLGDVDANGVSLDEGKTVAVQGVCTEENFNSTSSTSAFLQSGQPDGTLKAGINIYSGQRNLFVRGDEYVVTGSVLNYSGLTELVVAASSQVVLLGTATEVPTPVTLTIAELTAAHEAYEGSLVRVVGLNKVSGTWALDESGSFPTASNITLANGGVNLTARLNVGSTALTEPIYPAAITGIYGQFVATSPYTGGGQIQPRDPADIEDAPGLRLTLGFNQINEGGIFTSETLTISRTGGSVGSVSGVLSAGTIGKVQVMEGGVAQQLPYSFTIAEGVDSTTLTIEAIDNLVYGGDVDVVLTATDSASSNPLSSASVTLTILEDETAAAPDTTKPVIALLGANPLLIANGAAYTDPGATVNDNVDATRTITGSGTVNTAVAGDYPVTYNATDAAGNVADAVTRIVRVAAALGTTYSEWLNGATPSDPDAAFLDYVFGAVTPGTLDPSLKPTVAVTDGNLVLTYYVRQGTSGLTVTPKTSADLAAGPSGWVTDGVTVDNVGTATTVNGVSVQQKTASVPVSGAKKFLRVEAVQE